jgi:hypothetical protein
MAKRWTKASFSCWYLNIQFSPSFILSKTYTLLAPDTKVEEKPYMQRTGGKWDGADLAGKKGVGQGAAYKANEVDAKYEELDKKGLLTSNPWAKNMPWTNEAASQMGKKLAKDKKEAKVSATPEVSKKTEPEKKKGFFGW